MGRLADPAAGIVDMVGGGALLAMAAMAYVTASRGFGMPFRGYGAAGAPEEKFIGVRQPRAAYGRLRMAARPRKCSSRQQPHAQGGVGGRSRLASMPCRAPWLRAVLFPRRRSSIALARAASTSCGASS